MVNQKINQAIAEAIEDYGKIAIIDRAIKDYSKIAKQKKVFLSTLKNRDMELGLCHYFACHDFYLAWNKIPNRPSFKKISTYGWIYPVYYYNCTYQKKLDIKEIGIKKRLEFLLKYREALPKYLRPV